MKIKCKVCRRETEIDELDYKPGDKVIVECSRCGNEMEATIPLRENETIGRPKVRVVNQATEGEDSGSKPHSGAMSQEDLKSIWYAAGKASSSGNSVVDKIPPVPKQNVGYKEKPYNNNITRQNTTNRNKSKDAATLPGKIILYIVLAIGLVVGAVLWINSGRENDNVIYEDQNTVVMETPATEEINPLYELLDHPEKELTWSDIKDLEKDQLRILRNSYFARHGYIFNDPELTDFFSQFSWYHPYSKNVINSLSQIEKHNVELIREYEK